MTEEQWRTGWMRSLAVMFNGSTLDEADEMGEPLKDDSFLILLNSYGDKVTYTLPPSPQGRGWKLLMNTDDLEHPFHEQPMTADWRWPAAPWYCFASSSLRRRTSRSQD